MRYYFEGKKLKIIKIKIYSIEKIKIKILK